MVAIIDYGVGNLFSLSRSFEALGVECVISADPKVLEKADRLVLPGVGAFGDAATKLTMSGLGKFVVEQANKGKPLLGICLGMQLLFEKGFEYGLHNGLGLVPGEVRSIKEEMGNMGLKVPHIGWNALHFTQNQSPLFRYIREGDSVYFVHSYQGVHCESSCIATAEYGVELTAAVQRGNVFGCQFHPEKSGAVGLNILRAFCEWEGGAPC